MKLDEIKRTICDIYNKQRFDMKLKQLNDQSMCDR